METRYATLKARKRVRATLLLVLAAGNVIVASGAPITGQLNVVGVGVMSLESVTFASSPDARFSPIIVLPGGNTGSFSALNSGWTHASVRNPDAASSVTTPDWLVLAALPTVQFTLNDFTNPFAGPNGSRSSTASFSVRGTVMDTATSETSMFTGIFSATFQNLPYEQLLSRLEVGDEVTGAFSGQIMAMEAAVPEPSAISLTLSGLLLATTRLLRRSRR